MAKRSNVIEEIAGLVRPSRQSLAWHHRIAPEHAETIAEIKAAWKAGRFGKRRKPAAEAIAAYLTGQGIATVGYNGVLTWLDLQ